MKDTKTILLTLNEDLHARLKAISEKLDLPMRVIIRRAIEMLIDVEEFNND